MERERKGERKTDKKRKGDRKRDRYREVERERERERERGGGSELAIPLQLVYKSNELYSITLPTQQSMFN